MADFSTILTICEAKKISISRLARDINISYTGLQRIIKDNSTRTDTLERIANYLQVPITFFFPGESGGIISINENDYSNFKTKIEEADLNSYEKEILGVIALMATGNGVTKERFIKFIISTYEDIDSHNNQISEMKKTINLYQKVIEQNEVIIDRLLKEQKPKK